MRVKPCIVASIMALSLSAGPVYHGAYAANGSVKTDTSIVLAQNSNDKPGFFDKIFNRSKDKERAAKPLYLDRGQSPSSVKPYDFSQGRRGVDDRRKRNAKGVDWDSFIEARDAKVVRNTQNALAAGAAISSRMERKAEERRVASLAGSSRGGGAGAMVNETPKKMVYDPKKVWTYNPNQPQQQKQAPKIYNTNP